MEQGRVEFDSLLFQYTGPEQPRVGFFFDCFENLHSIGTQLTFNIHEIDSQFKLNWL